MKAKATIIAMFAAFTCLAKGVYFVSSGDFRTPTAKWIVETTEPNQEVEITPYSARTLSVYNNPTKYISEWSVKTSWREFTFGDKDNIRQGSGEVGEAIGSLGATNIAPVTFTFPRPGKHLVKMFNPSGNVYQQKFKNPYITALWVDDDRPIQDVFNLVTQFDCPNVKKLVWSNPRGKQMGMVLSKSTLANATNVVDLQILHPEAFVMISQETFNGYLSVTNDFVFPNVNQIGGYQYRNNAYIQYACIPAATNIGEHTFNLSHTNRDVVISQNLGLKRIRIGDGVLKVGQNTFYGHENLNTIEFATDSENWIDTWNNNVVVSNWIGAAQATENPNEAILLPQSGPDGVYYTGSRRIGSNANITIRILKVEKTN